MKWWRAKILWSILLCSLLLGSHLSRSADAFLETGNTKKSPRVFVVFVDMSGSANLARRSVYREAFKKIFPKLRQGDRIMVGTITSHSYIDFKPALDLEIPKKTIWVNRIQFEHDLSAAKEKIRKTVDRLLSRKRGTQRTEILNSLNIADTIFHDEKRQKILIILSDMIQDSKDYNFERVKVTNKYIDDVIRRREKQKLIPNLAGVKIYVAGASATDPQKYRSVEKFWTRYFAKSGADFSPHRYGHSLISFEKEE